MIFLASATYESAGIVSFTSKETVPASMVVPMFVASKVNFTLFPKSVAPVSC